MHNERPFNLIKSGLNVALTFLLYKPVITALRKSDYVSTPSSGPRRRHAGLLFIAGAAAVTCVLLVPPMNGII